MQVLPNRISNLSLGIVVCQHSKRTSAKPENETQQCMLKRKKEHVSSGNYTIQLQDVKKNRIDVTISSTYLRVANS